LKLRSRTWSTPAARLKAVIGSIAVADVLQPRWDKAEQSAIRETLLCSYYEDKQKLCNALYRTMKEHAITSD